MKTFCTNYYNNSCCFSSTTGIIVKNGEITRKKNFNTVPVFDGTRGDAAIADLFKDKYYILYNSVSSSSDSMDALHERIRHAIETQCDTNVESSLHTHSVSTADVIKAVKRLK